jgi:phosphatidylserine/phosphatidylglycerophosphate/cardiolipin synthase-like enzyme
MKAKFFGVWAPGLALAFALALGTAGDVTAQSQFAATGCDAVGAFSPRGGGKDLIIDVIASAKQSIHMATYSFTEPGIGKALLDAKKRGVQVAVVIDKDHNGRKPDRPSVANYLSENGVAVFITDYFKIQHNKYLVIDGQTVQTGSFNYSRSAELDNAENVLVLRRCPQVAAAYLNDWNKLRQVSKVF